METEMNTVQNGNKMYNFTLLCLQLRRWRLCSSGWPWPTGSCSAFDRTGCEQLSQKVVQCLSYLFLFRNSLISLRAENLLDSRRF